MRFGCTDWGGCAFPSSLHVRTTETWLSCSIHGPKFVTARRLSARVLELRCARLDRVGLCFATSARCDSGYCGRALCMLVLAREPVCSSGAESGCWRPEESVMLSLSTVLERRSDEQRRNTDPHARRTAEQWACGVVHDRAQAMLRPSTRRHREAATPRWVSCCREKASLDPRKTCTVGSENGVGNLAARRHTTHGPQLSFC